MLLPPKTEGDFELTPAGTHVAVCYRVIDLGTQQIDFKGETKKQHKIMLSWELCDEFMTQGRNEGLPFSIHKRYTLSSHEKSSLRKDLESWRGKPFTDDDFGKFDIKVLLGIGCMIGVVHAESNGKVYANISSIMKLPKGMSAKPPVNPITYFSLDDYEQIVYDTLSENLKSTISLSPEFQNIKGKKSEEAHDFENGFVTDEKSTPF